MSKRDRNTKFPLRPTKLLESASLSRKRLKIENKLAKFGHDAALQFDSDAWVALINEQRGLIAAAAGVDPSKVKIYVGH